MHYFFEPLLMANNGVLNAGESHHCTRVLRLSAGDRVKVLDGAGNVYNCTIIDPHPQRCKLKIDVIEPASTTPPNCNLAVAPPKNSDRLAWMVEKCTEIGLKSITPLICDKSERRVINHEKIESMVNSAIKQSGNVWRPAIMGLTRFESFVNQEFNGQKFIAHRDTGSELHLKQLYQKGEKVLILIGPEGDFSANEVSHALDRGFKPVSLGINRLRTETAALVACNIINLVND